MNKKWLGCVLVALAVAGVSWSQGGTAKAVEALEQQWLQSQKTNNPDLGAPHLAEAKATKYTSIEYEDVKVMVFGDAAVATGASKATGTDAKGKPLDNHVRWTDTWVKMPGGKWQCVAGPVSAIKP